MLRCRPAMDLAYRWFVRPLLFRLDPERAHRAACGFLRFLPDRPPPSGPSLTTVISGMAFPNPIGLAAGFDKEGKHAHLSARLGFGHVEVGTVTPHAQEGNPRPRLFRIVEQEALLNRMGFNSPGAEEAARSLALLAAESPRPLRIAVSIGKQRETAIEDAVADYRAAAAAVLPLADFLVLNISSPNTPGLRSLESPDLLRPLLAGVRAEAEAVAAGRGGARPPIFVKLSPDRAPEEIEAAAETAAASGAEGLVLTNTTTDPALLAPLGLGEGGLSGRPLAPRALEALRIARKATGGRLVLVSVGGVFTGDDAYERIRAGASLVQIYTSLVYRGPSAARSILGRLSALLARDGYANVAEAVGAESKGGGAQGSTDPM